MISSAVGVAVAVGVGMAVAVGIGVAVAVGMGVAVAVGVGVRASVGVAVGAAVAVCVGVGMAWTTATEGSARPGSPHDTDNAAATISMNTLDAAVTFDTDLLIAQATIYRGRLSCFKRGSAT